MADGSSFRRLGDDLAARDEERVSEGPMPAGRGGAGRAARDR